MKKSGREITRLFIAVALFSVAAFLFFSSTSFASASQFLPRFHRFGGDFVIDMKQERDVNMTPTGGIRTSDTVLEEKLRLSAGGYIYHPRFISFDGFLGAGLRQEKYESNSTNEPWTSSPADEYGLRVRILPRHPYSLELFTERRMPFQEGRLSPDQTVYYDRGVLFRYKKKRASLTLTSIENISEYGQFTVDSVTRSADGSYAIGPFSNSAGHRVTESVTSPSQARTTQTSSYFENNLYFKDASFTSHIDVHKLIQENPLSTSLFTDDSLTWKEQAAMSLPWNFHTSAEYRLEEDTITQTDTSAAPESAFSRETESTNLTIGHQLYNSLTTNYSINNISTRSTGGDIKTKSESLAVGYVKTIPWGRFITGIFGRSSTTNIKNAPTIPDEGHSINVSVLGICNPNIDGCFDLGAQSVDVNSIIVRVKSPFPPNDLILLTSADYIVTPIGNTVRITISNLPLGFPLPGTYDFHVTYSFVQETVEYETTDLGYNVRFELFNNRINPYYGYAKSDQKVLSGSLPGGPQNSETRTLGILVWNPPYSFTEEYQSLGSNINPSRTLRSIADYRENIAPDTSLYAKLYYITTSRHGISAYSDDTLGADARLQKFVPRKNLGLSLGVSYAHRDSFATSDTYSLNSSLMWRIGKLTITATAAMSETLSTTPTGKNTYVTEQYFLSVSRRLF